MAQRFSDRIGRLTLLAAAMLMGAPVPGRAQAWLPAKGEGYVSTVYTNVFSDTHYLPTERHDLGTIDSNAFLFDTTYGITDRMAVTVSLPLVISRYTGNFPHQGTESAPMDDETWHSTFQDFRFSVRYNALRGPIVITPFIGSALPSHKYEYWAHSAAGRRLGELHIGVAAARLLDGITPGLSVQGRYAYMFPQRVVDEGLDLRPHRSSADLEIGYFVTPMFRTFALAAAQITHRGIDLYPPGPDNPLTSVQRQHHDQIGRENFLNVGAGAAFEINESIGIHGSVLRQVAGRNSHQMDRAVSVGLTWTFRRKTVVF
jgi:hypothetical protein